MLFASQASFLYLDSSLETESERKTLVIALGIMTEIRRLGLGIIIIFRRAASFSSVLFCLFLRNEDGFVAVV